MTLTVAIDAMGGDHGPSVTVAAALAALTEWSDLKVVLVGDEATLSQQLGKTPANSERIDVLHATQVVDMDEPPATALRGKRDSSIHRAVGLVAEGAADACVSAGNTGALMAISRFGLKMLPGISRPAICAQMPGNGKHSSHVLDLGANVDSPATALYEFALMGVALASAVDTSLSDPSVALLNVGEEQIKGSGVVKAAAELLQESSLNYAGYCEGNDFYTGRVNVIVCDGFVGNVALKASEGVASLVSGYIKDAYRENAYARLAGLVSLPVLRKLKRRADPRRYNGASLLGLRGIVVKSHGGADAMAFGRAIDRAVAEVRHGLLQRIEQSTAQYRETRQAS